MDRLTVMKVESLLESGKLSLSGQVLTQADGKRAIVELGAVRWLDNDEMWALMHPHNMHVTVNFEEKNYTLKTCPFCGGGSYQVRPMGRVWGGMGYGAPSSVEILHHCDPEPGQPSRSLARVGRDIDSAVAAWNKRK